MRRRTRKWVTIRLEDIPCSFTSRGWVVSPIDNTCDPNKNDDYDDDINEDDDVDDDRSNKNVS